MSLETKKEIGKRGELKIQPKPAGHRAYSNHKSSVGQVRLRASKSTAIARTAHRPSNLNSTPEDVLALAGAASKEYLWIFKLSPRHLDLLLSAMGTFVDNLGTSTDDGVPRVSHRAMKHLTQRTDVLIQI